MGEADGAAALISPLVSGWSRFPPDLQPRFMLPSPTKTLYSGFWCIPVCCHRAHRLIQSLLASKSFGLLSNMSESRKYWLEDEQDVDFRHDAQTCSAGIEMLTLGQRYAVFHLSEVERSCNCRQRGPIQDR